MSTASQGSREPGSRVWKVVGMCGPDEVPWEAIKTRMRDGVFGILGQDILNRLLKHTEEGSVVARPGSIAGRGLRVSSTVLTQQRYRF